MVNVLETYLYVILLLFHQEFEREKIPLFCMVCVYFSLSLRRFSNRETCSPQTVKALIRLLFKKQSDLGLHSLPKCFVW